MEIERKYLVPILPDNLEEYPCRVIEQGYLNTAVSYTHLTLPTTSRV